MSDPRKNFICNICGYMVNDIYLMHGQNTQCDNCNRVKNKIAIELSKTSVFAQISIYNILNKFTNLRYYTALVKMQNIINYANTYNICLENAYETMEKINNEE